MKENLLRFDEDEILFREYYYLDKTKESIDLFQDKYKHDKQNLSYVLDKNALKNKSYEYDFMSENEDITIVKHPRYSPLFMHSHEYFEIIYILTGKAKQYIDEREIILEEGNVFFLAPHVKHGIEVFDDKTILLNILVKQTTFLDAFSSYVRDKSKISQFFLSNLYTKDKTKYLHFHSSQNTYIENYILQMYEEHMHRDDYSNRILCGLFSLMLVVLTRYASHQIESTTSKKKEVSHDIIHYMQHHYCDVTLEIMSQHFYFSVPYTSKWIKEHTGYGFQELLSQIRINKAKELLIHTSASVYDISLQIGYKNAETFIRVFKKITSLTPKQFRNNQTK